VTAPRWFARPIGILGAGWLVFVLYAYPGYMMTEAADELVDSRTNHFSDWHSAVMTEIWRRCGAFLSGPFPILVIQSLLLLAGAYHLLRRAMAPRAAAGAAIGVLLFPPVMAAMAVVGRDTMLAGVVVAAAAALLDPRRWVRGLGLGLLLVAGGLREGAELVVLAVGGVGFAWRDGQAWWRRAAIALVCAAAVAIGGGALDRALTDVETGRRPVTLASTDLLGVLRYAPPIDDASLRAAMPGVWLTSAPGLQARARILYVVGATGSDGPGHLFDAPTTGPAGDAIRAARDRLVAAYPGAYFAHRRHVFYAVLGLTTPWDPARAYTSFTTSDAERDATQHLARHSVVQKGLIAPVRWLSRTMLFRPYLYFFLALALVPLAVLRRRRDAVLLLAGGIVHELSLGLVATEARFRMSTTMIACTAIAGVLLAAAALAARRRPGL
jgi:hypothetical protein